MKQWRHQKFFVGSIEGAKCDSEGAKIQKYAQNMLILVIFSSDWGGGGKWGQSLWRGGGMPPFSPPPLDAATEMKSPDEESVHCKNSGVNLTPEFLQCVIDEISEEINEDIKWRDKC